MRGFTLLFASLGLFAVAMAAPRGKDRFCPLNCKPTEVCIRHRSKGWLCIFDRHLNFMRRDDEYDYSEVDYDFELDGEQGENDTDNGVIGDVIGENVLSDPRY